MLELRIQSIYITPISHLALKIKKNTLVFIDPPHKFGHTFLESHLTLKYVYFSS